MCRFLLTELIIDPINRLCLRIKAKKKATPEGRLFKIAI